jgi:hypothetical protein
MADLITFPEAERIARPCVLLVARSNGKAPAAAWRGPGVVPVSEGPYCHWLSIDCASLPTDLEPAVGVLSVYTNQDDCVSGLVAYDSSAKLVDSGVPLYAKPGRSLPPPDAIPSLDNEEYMRLWQSNCPLYTEQAMAVLGGWHFPWPDGDWEELRENSLLVWTIAESEPWVEVWRVPAGFKVMQRVT